MTSLRSMTDDRTSGKTLPGRHSSSPPRGGEAMRAERSGHSS
ncbi:hypothetical protein [Ramlibacter humi]|nr:hypothetical protein [Ramlibacter humi]